MSLFFVVIVVVVITAAYLFHLSAEDLPEAWYTYHRVTHLVYRVAHLVAEHFVDIKFKVPQQYKVLTPKCNSYFNVNKRCSSTRWTTLYMVSNDLPHG